MLHFLFTKPALSACFCFKQFRKLPEKELVDGLLLMAGCKLGGIVLAGQHLVFNSLAPDANIQGRLEIELTSRIAQPPLKASDALVLKPRVNLRKSPNRRR
ncbi:hypothetical protein YA0002_26050 [Pseudomonas cichorii]|uniref:hypothetical protein n=1 Tax=Pseudomonas cichorii TaxID=36746 RepID=UPI0018E6103D|nr:hypothetical protein [Pseudomonas cichorii]MBI6856225.1 hypothetical protein [Pseudomonas cichorii]